MSINIAGMNKAEVLAKLYNASKVQGMGIFQATPEDMTTEEAEGLLKESTYFDYLKGRVMKIDLSENDLRTDLYDRDNGQGAAKFALGI